MQLRARSRFRTLISCWWYLRRQFRKKRSAFQVIPSVVMSVRASCRSTGEQWSMDGHDVQKQRVKQQCIRPPCSVTSGSIDEENRLWECEYCGQRNDISDNLPEEIPREMDVVYLVRREQAKQLVPSHPMMIFCVGTFSSQEIVWSWRNVFFCGCLSMCSFTRRYLGKYVHDNTSEGWNSSGRQAYGRLCFASSLRSSCCSGAIGQPACHCTGLHSCADHFRIFCWCVHTVSFLWYYSSPSHPFYMQFVSR